MRIVSFPHGTVSKQTQNNMKKIRLRLAKWLWPKDVCQGDLFTIVRWLRDGKPIADGSWIGQTCRADKVDGDRISFSVFCCHVNRYKPVKSIYLIPGINCEVKMV